MSKHNQSVNLSCSAKDLLLFSQEIFRDFEWRVLSVTSDGISAKEEAPQFTSFTWPARIDLTVTALPDKETASRIDLAGSIAGLGPIQKNHLKGQMGRFLNALSLKVDTGNQPADETHPASEGLADELARLAELRGQGIIDDDEFQAAKKKLLD